MIESGMFCFLSWFFFFFFLLWLPVMARCYQWKCCSWCFTWYTMMILISSFNNQYLQGRLLLLVRKLCCAVSKNGLYPWFIHSPTHPLPSVFKSCTLNAVSVYHSPRLYFQCGKRLTFPGLVKTLQIYRHWSTPLTLSLQTQQRK